MELSPYELKEPLLKESIFKRVGHITASYRNFILVWGGFGGAKFGPFSNVTNYCPPKEICFYNCHTDVWTRRLTTGDVPPGTSGSTGVVHDDELYIFGGIEDLGGGNWACSNKLYRLDLLKLIWQKFEGTGQFLPDPCDKSVGWYYKERLYFFGGYGMRPSEPTFDYHYLIDISESNRGWNNQFVCYDLSNNAWIKPKVHGSTPSPRAAHSADMNGHLVYIFGGRLGQVRNNEMYCLDMETLTWSHNLTNEVIGPVPNGRSWHSFNFVSPKRAILYGGLLKYGIPAIDYWECLVDEKQNVTWEIQKPIVPRCWHQAGFCDLTGDLVIVGGVTKSPYDMVDEDLLDSMVTIRCQPKSLFRISMDVLLEDSFVTFPSEFLRSFFPKTLMQLLWTRLSQKCDFEFFK